MMNWLNLLLFLLLIMGHSKLWVWFVNFTHSFPLKCETLHRLRRFHDVMLFLGPILLIAALGLSGPRLLFTNAWETLSPTAWIAIALCSFGVICLTKDALRFQLEKPPHNLIEKTTHRIDIAKTLGSRPVGEGKYKRLAEMGVNEQFQVEFNEKTFELSGLPQQWSGLTILHLSDWHFYGVIAKQFYARVSEIAAEQTFDLVCFSGDLIDNPDLIDWIPETLGQIHAEHGCFYILGNHDWYQDPDEIRSRMDAIGWTDIASRTVDIEIRGHTMQIGGDETPWMGSRPKFTTAADFRISVSHTPDNFAMVRHANVELMLAGHTHGGQVRLPLLGPIYSPSRYGTRYASGSFWSAPTLMHVSRGLSGRHPFRFRCAPEVTRIVLQASPSS